MTKARIGYDKDELFDLWKGFKDLKKGERISLLKDFMGLTTTPIRKELHHEVAEMDEAFKARLGLVA